MFSISAWNSSATATGLPDAAFSLALESQGSEMFPGFPVSVRGTFWQRLLIIEECIRCSGRKRSIINTFVA
jgi:hypothetical protein